MQPSLLLKSWPEQELDRGWQDPPPAGICSRRTPRQLQLRPIVPGKAASTCTLRTASPSSTAPGAEPPLPPNQYTKLRREQPTGSAHRPSRQKQSPRRPCNFRAGSGTRRSQAPSSPAFPRDGSDVAAEASATHTTCKKLLFCPIILGKCASGQSKLLAETPLS